MTSTWQADILPYAIVFGWMAGFSVSQRCADLSRFRGVLAEHVELPSHQRWARLDLPVVRSLFIRWWMTSTWNRISNLGRRHKFRFGAVELFNVVSYSSTELGLGGSSTVVVGLDSVSRCWKTLCPESGTSVPSMFSSRKKALISRRWGLLTKFWNG